MQNPGPAERIGAIKESFVSGLLSADQLLQQLHDAGMNPNEANQWLSELSRQQKRELFNKTVSRNDNAEIRNVVLFITLMITMIGPVFDVTNPLWYIIALTAVGIAGYFGYKDKPVAGIAGTVAFGILFPLAYAQYFANKTSYIKIELLIPVAMAAIPAFLLLFMLSKTMYRGQD